MVTIDSFLKEERVPKVDVIKCDVEGYELQVLQGMVGTLEFARPRLLLEVNKAWCARQGYRTTDVFSLMRGFGYEYMAVTPMGVVVPHQNYVSGESPAASENIWFFPAEKGPGKVDVETSAERFTAIPS